MKMQIVINITNELYVRLMEMGDMDCGTFNESVLVEVIKNGIPLPKGHGDLIDRNDLLEFTDVTKSAYVPVVGRYQIITADTIIPAESED